jgi:hypothetical protein
MPPWHRITTVLLLWAAVQAAGQPSSQVPLRLHPDNGHYLQFRGKPTVLITSGEHYGAVLNLDFDYLAYLDELRENGLNLTRTFSGTYREVAASFGITDNTLAPARYLAPWARSSVPGAADGGNQFDLGKFDPAYFDRLSDFVSQASRRDIVVEFVLFCPFYEEDLWAVNPMNAANNVNGVGRCGREEVYTLLHEDLLRVQEAFVRKAVTALNRFDNVYFEICNEPYFGGVREDWQARIARTIVETEKSLPNRHLISQNIANGRKRIEKPDPSVSIFNFHYATPPDTVAENYKLNRVLADDETGFRGKNDVLYRTEGWDFIVAGGGIYSSLDYSFTPRHPDGTFTEFRSPGGGGRELRHQLRILKDFIHGFDFVRMAPHNEAVESGTVRASLSGVPAQARVSARVLAEPGKAYAVYVLGGSAVELVLSLPAGDYLAEWVDTKTGKIAGTEKFAHAGGARTLTSPQYQEDIALRILAR